MRKGSRVTESPEILESATGSTSRAEQQRSTTERDLEHRALANRAVAVSAIGLGITGAIELAIALVTGSVGLLGDALHNLSDVSTSAVVFFGFRMSKRAPTPRYPYGYDRAEDLAGLGVALVIWISALFAGYESVLKLISGTGTRNLTLGIAAAALGIVGNLAVSWYKRRIGERIHSSALIADARHSRLDALSSVGAMIGLFLVALGYPIGDPIAGLAVTVLIIHVGLEVTREVLHHLLDGVEPELIEQVAAVAHSAPGVEAVVDARGRWTGRVVRLEFELRMAGAASVIDAIATQAWIEEHVRAEHEMVGDVLVRLAPSITAART
jgi:cation diffusion facilitator family transporter